MSIRFEWYENPVPPEKADEKRIHARIALNGKTDTDEICHRIQARCSLTKTDVSAVLNALSHIMGEELADGKQIHLDGIGYFHPTLKCTEEVTAETKRKNTKVKLKSIRFRADQALKNEIGKVKLENIRHAGHSKKLSDTEIDMKLQMYFADHLLMTRSDFQQLCGFMKSKAMEHLRRLKAEGKIKNMGIPTQPIYIPVIGYYGVEEDRSVTR
jgi:predicted histone-like DNA-binding protein